MSIKKIYIQLLVGLIGGHTIMAQEVFSDFNDFMAYAEKQSLALTKGEIELTKAKKQRLIAILGLLDNQGSIGVTYKNNTELPVTLVPSELGGGEAGQFDEVQFGLQYETLMATSLELKLFNLAGWSQMKLAKIDIDLAENNQKITRKELYENAAKAYYNILTLQAQLRSTENNLTVADTLRHNVDLRFDQGLENQQNLNDAKVNFLRLQRSKSQIEFTVQQQYRALKALCDIEEKTDFTLAENPNRPTSTITAGTNRLGLEQANLSERQALSSLRRNKFNVMAPTLSFLYYDSRTQFNEDATLFDTDVDWIPSSYFGFRLSVPLPTFTQSRDYYSAKYDHLVAKENRKQAQLQMFNQTKVLQTDYEKARSEEEFDRSIYLLTKETYQKNFLSYEQGVVDLDLTLTSFQDMVNAEYEWISSKLSVALNREKININNTLQ